MSLAGWEIRIVKKCDRGLEIAARGRRPRAAYSSPRSDLRRIITCLSFFAGVNWLTSGFVYATLSFNRLTLRPQNRFISNYFMLVAFSSTVKFCKIVLPMWNFVQSLKYFVISTKLIAVSRCESPEIRLFLPQIEYQIAIIKEENSTEIIFT